LTSGRKYEMDGGFVIDNNDDENRHFDSICAAFRNYVNFAISQWTHREQRLQALPDSRRKLLPACLSIGFISIYSNAKEAG